MDDAFGLQLDSNKRFASAASLHGKRPREISFVVPVINLASWQEQANLRGKQLERYARLLLERNCEL